MENHVDLPAPESSNYDSPYIFPSVVNIDYSKARVALCDTENGNYAIEFQNEIPAIVKGSVVLVPEENNMLVVLVTNSIIEEKRVVFSGRLGDLRYVFKDTEFILRIGEQDASSNGKSFFYPEGNDVTTTRAEKSFTLWDAHYSEDFTIWSLSDEDYTKYGVQKTSSSEEYANAKAHAMFDPLLVADITFRFGKEIESVVEGIVFLCADSYDVESTITGDFHSSLDFDFSWKLNDEWAGILLGDKDPRILLKHDLFHKDFIFVVYGVPVWIHSGCDLFSDFIVKLSGEANLTFGTENDIHMMARAKVAPYLERILDYDTNLDISWKKHDPIVSLKENIEVKWHLYPHFYFWIYGGAGPCIDIKPFAQLGMEYSGSADLSEPQHYDDYCSLVSNGSVGIDWAVGISSPLENYFYEANVVTKELGTIIEKQVLQSPTGLLLENGPDEIKAGYPATFDFKVVGEFYGETLPSWLPTIIKIDFPKSGESSWLFAYFGKASYTWTPGFEDDRLVARVFDIEGKELGKLEFVAGPGDAVVQRLCPDDHHPHAIDMGFGIKWACCNVGANAPHECGDFFAWGETSPKSDYSIGTYKWIYHFTPEEIEQYDIDPLCQFTKYCSWSRYGYDGFCDNKRILDLSDDAAQANWGGKWRMPNNAEVQDLGAGVAEEYILNGVQGCLLTGSNGNRIFIPYAGTSYEGQIYSQDHGFYWSSERGVEGEGFDVPGGMPFFWRSDIDFWPSEKDQYSLRFWGMLIRPIYDD